MKRKRDERNEAVRVYAEEDCVCFHCQIPIKKEEIIFMRIPSNFRNTFPVCIVCGEKIYRVEEKGIFRIKEEDEIW